MDYKISFAPEGALMELKSCASDEAENEMVVLQNLKGEKIYFSDVSRGKVFGKRNVRGQIRGFSESSRSRLAKKLSLVRRQDVPLFVTLTYGESFSMDVRSVKRDLDVFFKSIHRKYRGFGAVWKLERQQRGAWHFHLLLWGVSYAVRDDLVDIWYGIAGRGDIRVKNWHLGLYGNEHCVTVVRSWHGVSCYAAKYMSKLDDGSGITGRIWGCVGKIPFSKILEFRVSFEQALEFRKALQDYFGFEFRHFGFWCGNYDVRWLIVLEGILSAEDVPIWHDVDFDLFDDPL